MIILITQNFLDMQYYDEISHYLLKYNIMMK